MSKRTIRLSLNLSPETDILLESLCEQGNMTKSELFRKSVALMEIALNYKKKGDKLAILDKDDKKISEIIGI